jgi:hypothetical protein
MRPRPLAVDEALPPRAARPAEPRQPSRASSLMTTTHRFVHERARPVGQMGVLGHPVTLICVGIHKWY